MTLRHLPSLLREPGREHPSDELPGLVEELVRALDAAGHSNVADEPYHIDDIDYLVSLEARYGPGWEGDCPKLDRRCGRRLLDVIDEYRDADTIAKALE